MKSIEKQLQINEVLLREIEKLIVKIDVLSDNKKDMLLIGFLRNSLSHYLSINLLIKNKLYNSAFALERVLYENIIRAKTMYLFFNDTRILKMYDASNWDSFFNNKETNIGIMCNNLDEHYTGPNQIARNFNEENNSVESNFSEDLICDVLKGNFKLIKTFVMLFLEIGFNKAKVTKEEMQNILDLNY